METRTYLPPAMRVYQAIASSTRSIILTALLLTSGAAMMVGCSLLPPGHTDASVYSGLYAWGFEENGFSPCSEDAAWWVVTNDTTGALSDSLVTRYNRIADQHYEQVFVRFKGSAGPKGAFGHLGVYEREFDLEDIVEMRKAKLGECGYVR